MSVLRVQYYLRGSLLRLSLAGELVGGEERIDTELFYKSGDSLICNFGTPYWTEHSQHPKEFGNW